MHHGGDERSAAVIIEVDDRVSFIDSGNGSGPVLRLADAVPHGIAMHASLPEKERACGARPVPVFVGYQRASVRRPGPR